MYHLLLHPSPVFSNMAIHTIVAAALALCLVATAALAPAPPVHDIAACLVSNGVKNFSLPASPSFNPLLLSSLRYLRFVSPSVGKPSAIVLPSSQLDLQRAVLCAVNASLAIRVRAGGHSYEGLSYTSENGVPFAVIDVSNLNKIRVDASTNTVWAESGATLGELYHAVGEASKTLAFPGGTCSTLGLGGFVSGGGFGLLARKHGIAADNVLDAILIDASGRALNRDTMDADVFWAIRGGGGGSWGVVYSWKLQLVTVPDTITVFDMDRHGPADDIAGLVHKWQSVGPSLPDEFYVSTRIYFTSKATNGGNLTMSFTGHVLAPKREALAVLNKVYPELRLAESELSEVSWVEAAAKFALLKSVADLASREVGVGEYAKRKSDYVQAPISRQDVVKIMRYVTMAPTEGSIQLNPYGAAMARIGSGERPFPHRAGFLYSIQYAVDWKAAENGRAGEFMGWLREFYKFMEPYVSKNPRGAYVNYVDLDLGTNNWTSVTGGTLLSAADSVSHAASWGRRYFLNNFDRLVRAKSKIDPGNVFNNAQSIPPLR
ncbi:unnamed protein product [Urochloa decumbens]|uniref:FAD-binding PCMH-type domain-containing protein n=1 Tax=Urochloa decumbens TaxID=240449 RepID=A0ABC9BR01_9POAL